MKKVLIIITLTMLLVGLTKVKASTFTEQTNQVGDDWLEITNASDWIADYPYYKKTIGTNNGNLQSFLLTYQTRNSNQGKNYDYVVFKFLATQPKNSSVTDTVVNQSCKTWTPSHYTSSGQIDQWSCSSVYSDSSLTGFEETSTLNNLGINVVINYSGTWNNQWSSCSIIGNEIFCPTGRKTIKNIEFKVAFNPGYSTTFDLYLLRGYQLHNKLPNTQDIINNQNNNFNNFMEQNQTYTDELNQNIKGSQEIGNYTQMEEDLINNIDLNASVLDGIAINTNTSNFIWQIVDGLRGMNIAIVTLFTSLLGLGIVKLVLNR